jgi:periplasmic protein TonB
MSAPVVSEHAAVHPYLLHFQPIARVRRTRLAEITAQAEPSAARELATPAGVYRSVFEQSLLVEQGPKRPWNFLASAGAELLVVSLALVIPLLYSDHLPLVHWKDVVVGPPPAPPPKPLPVVRNSGQTNSTPGRSLPRPFQYNPSHLFSPSDRTPVSIGVDAPPVIGGIGAGGSSPSIGTFIPNVVAPPPPKPVETQKAPSAPVPVGGDVQMAKLLKKVIPAYPALAKSVRISGVVHLVGIIGKDGTIRDLQLVSGHPMLARAAIEAVQQWVYKPTLLNGVAVEVIAPIEVNFTLAQ